MTVQAELEGVDLLVTVKAYPQASDKYGEAVCVAGVRLDGPPSWVRLYPIEFRDLPWEQRFKKYDRIRIQASRRSDDRPESYFPERASIEVVDHVSTARGWQRRRELLEGLEVHTMCELQRRQQQDGTSLGMVALDGPPELEIEAKSEAAVEEDRRKLARARSELFSDFESGVIRKALTPLEPFPFYVRYRWGCPSSRCKQHRQSIIDWELPAAWRQWRRMYGDTAVWDHIRKKWVDMMFAPDRSSFLFCGNMHQRPSQFLVLGVFYPQIKQ